LLHYAGRRADPAALPDYDVLYFSGITLAVLGVKGREKLLETLIEARQRDARIVFDNNYRPRLWASVEEARAAYRSVLPYVDMALLTVDDEQALFHFSDCERCSARTSRSARPKWCSSVAPRLA
jgi:2-dehydro-3-deoxygluconokinase